MRTWNGIVNVVADGEIVGQVHADLAADVRGGKEVWWGQLRGASRLHLDKIDAISLRLPSGQQAAVDHVVVDRTDLYHRTEIDGVGPVPF